LIPVDIVIPCHEQYDLLELCLKSIFNGTQRFNKVILVDDDSSSRGTLEEYFNDKFPEIKYVRNKERSYFSGTVNHGLEHVTSKYVLVLNSDTEMVTPDCLSVMVEELECDPLMKMVNARISVHELCGPNTSFTFGYAFLMEREFLRSLGDLRSDGYYAHFNSDCYLYRQLYKGNYQRCVSSVIIKHRKGSSTHLVPKSLCKFVSNLEF